MVVRREGSGEVIGTGEDDDRAWPARQSTGRRRWLAFGLVFALGVVVGAAGRDRWRDISDERSRRSAVTVAADLGAVFGPAINGGERTISVVARLRNTGPLPVEVIDLQLHIPGLDAPAGASILPATLTLEPGATETMRLARILRCEELAVTGDEPLVIRARTADGGVRERRIALTDDVVRLGEFVRSQCERRDLDQSSAFLGSVGWTKATWNRADRVVRSNLTVQPVQSAGATVTAVDSASPGWTADGGGLPIEVPPDTRHPVTVVWRVADCVMARQLELSRLRLDVTGRRTGGRELTTSVRIEPLLADQMARLLESQCGAA
jgi:hypothetical protein